MINEDESRRLRELIFRYELASVNESWKGGGDPDDIPEIDRKYKAAGDQLWAFIDGLTRKPTPSRTKKSSPSSPPAGTRSARKRRK